MTRGPFGTRQMPSGARVAGLLAGALAALPLAACGERAARPLEERLAAQPGFWFEARPDAALEQRQRELAAMGYADGYVPVPAATGVTLHDRERAQPGLNLYSSGHGPEAFLIDMEGDVLHRWSLPYDALAGAPPMEHPSQVGWRRVRLLADGSLLAIHGGLALIKIDRDSRLVWLFPGHAHHDLELLPDGRVLTLTRRLRIVDGLSAREPVVEDFVTVLSADGELLLEVSLIEALRTSSSFGKVVAVARRPDQAQRLTTGGVEALDLLHANSIQTLDGRHVGLHPAFAAGNVLVCLRELDALVVVNLQRRRVVWYREGAWLAPHDPRLTDEGHLLIFDNMGHDGYSQVLELDPLTGEELWAFRGDPPESLYSTFCGTARRLANGNTLLTESCNGRALEVTPAGAVVWAFHSPHRAGEERELVAVLFEVERLAAESVAAWLER